MSSGYLKNYSTWKRLNESASYEEYCTITFPHLTNDEFIEKIKNQIIDIISSFTGISLDSIEKSKKYDSYLIVQLSLLEDDDFSLFNHPLLENQSITLEMRIYPYLRYLQHMQRLLNIKEFKIIRKRQDSSKYYCSIPKELQNLSEKDLRAAIFDRDSLSEMIFTHGHSRVSNIKRLEITNQVLEDLLISADPKKIKEANALICENLLADAILAIYMKELIPATDISLEKISKDSFAEKADTRFKEIERAAKSSSSLSQEEKKKIFLDILIFEKYLAQFIPKEFIVSPISIFFLRKTQTLLQELGFSDISTIEQKEIYSQLHRALPK